MARHGKQQTTTTSCDPYEPQVPGSFPVTRRTRLLRSVAVGWPDSGSGSSSKCESNQPQGLGLGESKVEEDKPAAGRRGGQRWRRRWHVAVCTSERIHPPSRQRQRQRQPSARRSPSPPVPSVRARTHYPPSSSVGRWPAPPRARNARHRHRHVPRRRRRRRQLPPTRRLVSSRPPRAPAAHRLAVVVPCELVLVRLRRHVSRNASELRRSTVSSGCTCTCNAVGDLCLYLRSC
jgi:hypothetical protein